MIEFASYLDGNQRQITKATEKIKKLEDESRFRDKEIARKREQLKILEQQDRRIEQICTAVKKYQDFLEKVKEKNPDQYETVEKIIDRYDTLTKEENKLKEDVKARQTELNGLKVELVKIEKEYDSQIMSLGNEISKLKQDHEKLTSEKEKKGGEEEREREVKKQRVNDIAKIMFSIDHLEMFCLHKTLHYDKKESKTQYTNVNEPKDQKSKQLMKQNFEDYEGRKLYAIAQLTNIGHHLKDFQEVIEKCKQIERFGEIPEDNNLKKLFKEVKDESKVRDRQEVKTEGDPIVGGQNLAKGSQLAAGPTKRSGVG